MKEFLCLRPFPQNTDDPDEKRDSHTKYRRTILVEAVMRVIIVVFSINSMLYYARTAL